ncbi:helix-turn-helix transcriptional regulator [Enterococcus sp. BWB1-3]|uniref:helix-turn-helix domain-containing protein n=1 Tax=unclassified Enterococcus TaxID=2608891 RepID=UPI0019241BC0|nr:MULTISPECIES: helix-turn-helix transcriptional regulator [unclassified Enterococcus]MBL1228937.1 helix-turn-helix transcriptional regulator [Enterococcus sp. BWB1-3]MCB5951519.1 helix-turn-helix domain-containing protein [Enterococcus sp. BWT-B8]MCB5956406.1 helix-turn-helix domain-containing protein [Enterococcus sp. CWB-B31]
MALAERLRLHRENKGLSQATVAAQLNVSRQSVSKWETGKGYPDIDNLILLSQIYEVSIDELLQENEVLKQKIEENNETIEEYRRKLDWMHDPGRGEKDEGLLLLIAVIGLSVAAPLGLLLAPIIMKRNKKSNTFYRLINVVSVCCFLINLYFTFIMIGDYLLWDQKIEVNYMPES